MAKPHGTQTEKNVLAAFAGESQARNRYTYFASAAKKEDMSRFQPSSRKRPRMRRNTPSGFLSSWRAGMPRLWPSIRPV